MAQLVLRYFRSFGSLANILHKFKWLTKWTSHKLNQVLVDFNENANNVGWAVNINKWYLKSWSTFYSFYYELWCEFWEWTDPPSGLLVLSLLTYYIISLFGPLNTYWVEVTAPQKRKHRQSFIFKFHRKFPET